MYRNGTRPVLVDRLSSQESADWLRQHGLSYALNHKPEWGSNNFDNYTLLLEDVIATLLTFVNVLYTNYRLFAFA